MRRVYYQIDSPCKQQIRLFLIFSNVPEFGNDNLDIIITTGTTLEIPDQDINTDPIGGIEFSGGLSLAAGQGAKFALLLAMLEQDVLHNPYFEPQQAPDHPYASVQLPVSDYPEVALSATEQHWSSAALTGELISNAYLASARLWQTMHPSPLSIFNDATIIDQQVVSNCDLYTQRRLRQETAKPMAVDETKLYDILHELQGTA